MANTLTLRNAASTINAVIKYPQSETAYPLYEKNFTKYQLSDGTFAYDLPTTFNKRKWDITIKYEDASDLLLTNLKTLWDLGISLKLDVDIAAYNLSISGLDVMFEDFRAIPLVGSVFNYQVSLQEL